MGEIGTGEEFCKEMPHDLYLHPFLIMAPSHYGVEIRTNAPAAPAR